MSNVTAVPKSTEMHGPPKYYTQDWISARASVEKLAALGAIDAIRSSRPSLVQGTPTTLGLLVGMGWRPEPHTTVLSCGEPLPSSLALQLASARCVWNLYGPTETTQCAVAHQVDAIDAVVPIGRPLPGVVVEIVDGDGGLVPLGLPGEITLGGPGLARGYLGEKESQAFIDTDGGRRYRTGDLGRWRRDGLLECLGRADRQLKRNGVRIEPGDIEAALHSHPAVRAAMVGDDGDRLVAWVSTSSAVSDLELRQHLFDVLPRSLVPDAIVLLDSLPMLPNGKVDRAALPEPLLTSKALEAPVGFTEERLAMLWSSVLGAEVSVGRDDDFFALGGHSLLAIQVAFDIERLFGRHLPFTQFFTTPSVAGMAAFLDAAPPIGGHDHDRSFDSALIPIRKGDPTRPLLLWVPGTGGTTLSLHRLATQLPSGCEFMGFEAAPHRGLPEPVSFSAMAQAYADDVRGLEAAGIIGRHRPYVIGGHSFGASLAFEIARNLFDDCPAGGVVLVDPLLVPEPPRRLTVRKKLRQSARRVRRQFRPKPAVRVRNAKNHPPAVMEVKRMSARLRGAHRFLPYPGSIVLITSEQRRRRLGDELLQMRPFVQGSIDAHPLSGQHATLLTDERTADIAAITADVVNSL